MIDIRRGDKWQVMYSWHHVYPYPAFRWLYTSYCHRIESLDKKLLIDFPIIKEFSFTTEQFVI